MSTESIKARATQLHSCAAHLSCFGLHTFSFQNVKLYAVALGCPDSETLLDWACLHFAAERMARDFPPRTRIGSCNAGSRPVPCRHEWKRYNLNIRLCPGFLVSGFRFFFCHRTTLCPHRQYTQGSASSRCSLLSSPGVVPSSMFAPFSPRKTGS